MRRALLAVLIVGCGGCGSTSPPTVIQPTLQRTTTAPCVPPVPAHMGECVPKVSSVTRGLSAPSGTHGVDVSVYQGYPNWSATQKSIRFVYNQTGDGTTYSDPNFIVNWKREKSLGLVHGAYLFERPGSPTLQADRMAGAIKAAGGQDTKALPPAIDAEVPGAYSDTCAIAARLRSDLHIKTVVVYTSPGLWPGGSDCGSVSWVADYGVSFPLNASSWTSHVAWQYTSTGFVSGISGFVDMDLDGGLLALLPRPKPSLQTQLDQDYRLRKTLRSLLTKRRCRTSTPTHGYGQTCRIWLTQGAQVNKAIQALHKRGAY